MNRGKGWLWVIREGGKIIDVWKKEKSQSSVSNSTQIENMGMYGNIEYSKRTVLPRIQLLPPYWQYHLAAEACIYPCELQYCNYSYPHPTSASLWYTDGASTLAATNPSTHLAIIHSIHRPDKTGSDVEGPNDDEEGGGCLPRHDDGFVRWSRG